MCTEEFYKSCLKPHSAQVGEENITFILQMKKKKTSENWMHAELLRANSKWILQLKY